MRHRQNLPYFANEFDNRGPRQARRARGTKSPPLQIEMSLRDRLWKFFEFFPDIVGRMPLWLSADVSCHAVEIRSPH